MTVESLFQFDFRVRRRLPMVFQTEGSECALACLAMVASYHGFQTDLATLRGRFVISLKGVTLNSVIKIADGIGLSSRAVRVDLAGVRQLRLPAILHWDLNHFVVLKEVGNRRFRLHDPGRGVRDISVEEFSASFTGVALELAPNQQFQAANHTSRLKLSNLWSRMLGLRWALAQAFLLSIVLQIFLVLGPLYLQFVIDEVVPRYDTALLFVISAGFALFLFVNVAASALRNLLFLAIGNLLGFQIAGNVARHMLKLPLAWFERRHCGDIVSRFSSITPIQNALTTSLVAGIVDGAMAIITVCLMFAYSAVLSLISLAALGLIVCLRATLFHAFRGENERTIMAQAKQDTFLIETVRGILPLRLFSAEADRYAIWQNRLAETANARLNVGRLSIAFSTANDLLLGVENILSVFIAAQLVLQGGFSLGMLFSYLSYKTQFLSRASALVERGIEFRMLDLHLDRISDIAMSSPEVAAPSLLSHCDDDVGLRGALRLSKIRFRYGDAEPWVLSDINLEIEPGEHVALTGPSGGGKTTLLKIMLGLLPPTSGDVLIDGEPLAQFGMHRYRREIAAVMQDDTLFAGSIASNIALFDPRPDTRLIAQCAEMAGLQNEILTMPMRYETLVGDMGMSLSGGQRQRVLIARALYRKPRILFMDEGTAFLDAANEDRVRAAISGLGITRVVVAHRSETLSAASRLIFIRRNEPTSGVTNELSAS